MSVRVQGNVRPRGLLLQDNPFRLERQQRSSDLQAASRALTVQATPTPQEINKKLKRSQQFSMQSRMGLLGRAVVFSHLYVQCEKLRG